MTGPAVRDRRVEALGTCPNCGATIPSVDFLVEYETSDRGSRVFAECCVCDDVVHPA